MHIVTKILIVFGAILSILLSALVIAFSFNADAIRDSVKSERDARIAAQNELSAERSRTGTDAAAAQSQIQAKEQELQTMKASADALRSQLAQEIETRRAATTQVDTLRNQFNELVVTNQTQATVLKSLKDELDASRKQQLDTSRQMAEVMEKLNESERLRQVLDQTARALREQLEEAKIAMEQAKSGSTATAAAKSFESAGPRVTARVTRVFKSASGDDMAAINLGSQAGLKANMKMNIVRDGFVASLVLVEVDMNEAVGKIEKLGRDVSVQAEDLVLSRLD